MLTESEANALRDEHYNAQITYMRKPHPELMVLRVKPNEALKHLEPGQYTTLGLGFWEPRVDGHGVDEVEEKKQREVVRRPYSVSSTILDRYNHLHDASEDGELEFYVVLVHESAGHIPDFTPRLFLRHEGNRIAMGRKIAGHYQLENVESDEDIIFLATGTGEAPHNQMVLKLLRNGHRGKIVSACSVRYEHDLGYADVHQRLMNEYPNYHYVALTTREPDTINHKIHLQEFIESGRLEALIGANLYPTSTHFFLCGNPAMIGIPKWEDDVPLFPESLGICEILDRRGFTISRPRAPGNVHFEEYW